MKYKLKPYDEANDIYLLYRHKFWFFWTFVNAGSRKTLENYVKATDGILINK